MIHYSWFFNNLTVLTNYNGRTNVVKTINWRYHGMDDDGFYATITGSTDIDPPYDTFVDYDNLTHAIVEEWIINKLGEGFINEMKVAIEKQINEQIAPEQITLPIPWTE